MDDLLTSRELQALLCVDRKTIYRMLHDKRLPAVRVGGQWRFSRQSIEKWLSEPSDVQPANDFQNLPAPLETLPLDCFRSVQDVFADALDVGVVTTNLEGEVLVAPNNACAFCKLILESQEGRRRCAMTWTGLRDGSQAVRVTQCHAGLECARGRIDVDGNYLGMVFACQFITSEKQRTVLRRNVPALAQECGIDPLKLKRAAKEITITGTERAGKIVTLVEKVAKTFSNIGNRRLELILRLRQVAKLAAV